MDKPYNPFHVQSLLFGSTQSSRGTLNSEHRYPSRENSNFRQIPLQGIQRTVEMNQHLARVDKQELNIHKAYQDSQQTGVQQVLPDQTLLSANTKLQAIPVPRINTFVNFFPGKLFASLYLSHYKLNDNTQSGAYTNNLHRLYGFVFNGFLYFSHINFHTENFDPTLRRKVVLSVKFTYEVDNNFRKDQVFILILLQCLDYLNLKLVGNPFHYPKNGENLMTVDFDVCYNYEQILLFGGTPAPQTNDQHLNASHHNSDLNSFLTTDPLNTIHPTQHIRL